MPDWWSYGLSDFLLFSPRVYYRLFELLNEALWPAQLLTIGAGIALLYRMARPGPGGVRLTAVVLGALWIWIAGAFFWDRYATINWSAAYMAPGFVLQGMLLIGAGVMAGQAANERPRGAGGIAALVLFGAAVLLYPWLAPLLGRSWQAAEIFGIAPDPTAIATLAFLALLSGRRRWLLMALPLLWCAISAATLWTMGSAEFLVPLGGALAAVAIAVGRSGAGSDESGMR
ncbi:MULTISPECIES: DUF6064 family protein [Rhodomicrobium]|uniref:DUF6064 family protein n=1 Tax=Rhodomicrobium TaxID=1068 RepID=UPI000B4AC61A|nr:MULTISPECIES: DUF6064 family protein [Rhodomicrobium]